MAVMPSSRTFISEGTHAADVVHITLISEAYTKSQEHEFFDDASRLISEAFTNPGAAFETLVPLLAIHAIYVPSAEDHVPLTYGVHVKSLRSSTSKTVFGLQREDGPLRTIAPKHDRNAYVKARSLCQDFSPGCHHVMLLVRDQWYGGLGDEVAIFTSSKTSGALALRHELGHILADVGEEYDGGSDYSGPNFSESNRLCDKDERPQRVRTYDGIREVWPCISWGAWLPPNRTYHDELDGSIKAKTEEVKLSLAQWPFADLSLKKSQSVSFPLNVQSNMQGTRVLLSTAGVRGHKIPTHDPPTGDGVTASGNEARFEVTIAGHTEVVPISPTFDRSFFSFVAPPLSPSDTVSVSLKSKQSPDPPPSIDQGTPPPLLCHIQVHQYQSFVPDHASSEPLVGAFPVFGDKSTVVGYRPMDEQCLMRRMNSPCFCHICLEQLWRRVLPRAGLLRVGSSGDRIEFDVQNCKVKVHTAPLGKFSTMPTEDRLDVKWFKSVDSLSEVEAGEGGEANVPQSSTSTCWRARARLRSSHIRREPRILEETASLFLTASRDSITHVHQLPALLRSLPANTHTDVTSQVHKCFVEHMTEKGRSKQDQSRSTKWLWSHEVADDDDDGRGIVRELVSDRRIQDPSRLNHNVDAPFEYTGLYLLVVSMFVFFGAVAFKCLVPRAGIKRRLS